ncbi:conserved Plasmodium protein, unknown function [Plasmodium chabaudi chabaudi]|uniref:Uncharacterized protein n=1 Tax=Plasmodium chabaudi chabaudi TaxID=31271 RepID=A0A4V0K568_PLACU|nr:conserved Plasmodium protein, unknown function [Plasmodium chabaudi chabaudi]VTZ67706.1 conserved Plasmodium protein, unknown function [Plasmodium chabaudi chabaudi]|eukprot:XP_739049.2 conserved Plasmodium protein, unknown function [Plasmodium chabaudi chabaudi]
MITPSADGIETERRTYFRYFIIFLFIFTLTSILQNEKEEEEAKAHQNKVNLRQNDNYRNPEFMYLRNINRLKYKSAIYITPNKKVMPSITYYNNSTIYFEGYNNIFNNFENVALGINKIHDDFHIYVTDKDNINTDKNIICMNNDTSKDSCAIINTILIDNYFFKNINISSCNDNNELCFFVLVQLKKSKCYNFNNLSNSCHINNAMKNHNIFLINNYCYVILASSDVNKIYEFIKLHLATDTNFDENTKMDNVQIVSHFCGNVLNQVATLDAVNGRLLFIQQYIHKNDNYNETNKNEEHQKKSPNVFLNNYSNQNNNNDDTLKFKINYYLTIMDLKSENKDIIEYVQYMKNKPELSIYQPMHISFDEHSNLYYIVQHGSNGSLNFIFISPSQLLVYYTLKIKNFYSGWLLNSDNEHENKGIVLFGEYPPYEDELHIWDITNFQHRKYLVNIIKTY